MTSFTKLARAATLPAGLAVAAAGLAVGGAPAPAAAAPVPAIEGSLQWSIHTPFVTYVEGPIAHGSVTVGGGASRAGDVFEFPLASGTLDGSAAADAAFAGSVLFQGHDFGQGPILNVQLADPQVVISGTTGAVVADMTYSDASPSSGSPEPPITVDDVEVATLDLAAVTPVAVGEDGWRWSDVPASLTAAGAEAFAGFYEAGLAIAPVTLTLASAPIPKYQPLTPARLLDTRAGGATGDGAQAGTGPVTGGSTVELLVAGRGGVPPDAAAAVLNVTVAGASGAGYVTVWPCAAPQPNASSLNFVAGQTVPNAVVAKIGVDGKVCLFVADATTDLIADVNGYFPAGSAYTPLSPARYLDTRAGGATFDGAQAGTGPVAAGKTVTLPVADRGEVPADATAVVLNVTVAGAQGAGYVTVWPCGVAQPNASSLNFVAGQTVPNAVVATVGAGGTVCLAVAESAADLIVDVAGYFPPGAGFTSLTPARLADTRAGGTTVDTKWAGTGARTAGSVLELPVAGRGGVPEDASAVVLNVTVAGAQGAGYVTVWPCGVGQPNASSLNFVAGQTVPNAVVAKIGTGGKVCFFVADATTHLLVDVGGAFAA